MKTKRLVVSAMLIAAATVLSLIQPFALPFGGRITLVSMMPIVILAYMYGTSWGLFSAFVYALLQMVTDLKTVSSFFMPGDSQMAIPAAIGVCIFDYVLAFTSLGLGGIFKGKFNNPSKEICLGAIVATIARYIMHIISGAIFFGAWAEWFFSQDNFYKIGEKILSTFSGAGLAFIYSVFYNGLYMIPEIIITAIVTPIVYKAVSKTNLIKQ